MVKKVTSAGFIVVKAAVVVLALSALGYLVADAHQRANPTEKPVYEPGSSLSEPDEPISDSPASEPAVAEVEEKPTYMFSSKSFAGDVMPAEEEVEATVSAPTPEVQRRTAELKVAELKQQLASLTAEDAYLFTSKSVIVRRPQTKEEQEAAKKKEIELSRLLKELAAAEQHLKSLGPIETTRKADTYLPSSKWGRPFPRKKGQSGK